MDSDLGYVVTRGCGRMHLEPVRTSGIESHFHLKLPVARSGIVYLLIREMLSAVLFKRHLKSLFLDQLTC